ncbi:MAG: hypothetical protein Q8L81_07400 [Bacteroidota bacterium]|nr:hypothetical protein [Bacteroidota bacterium]
MSMLEYGIKWKNFNLVFTTAHREHALKALKINANDYLLKPIDHKELQFAVNKIKQHVANNEVTKNEFDYTKLINTINQYQRKKIVINSKAGVESIDLPEIISIEALSNYTQISLNNSRSILTSKILRCSFVMAIKILCVCIIRMLSICIKFFVT